MQVKVGEDVGTGGGIALYGGLVLAAQFNFLEQNPSHCREPIVIWVDIE